MPEFPAQNVAHRDYLLPSTWKYTSHDLMHSKFEDLPGVLTTQLLRVTAVLLAPGNSYTAVRFCSGTTALAGGSNLWACLLDKNLVVRAVSADLTTAAWAANALKDFTFAAAYSHLREPQYGYYGVLSNATTVPSLKGVADSDSVVALWAPARSGNCAGALTTPPAIGATMGAISGSNSGQKVLAIGK